MNVLYHMCVCIECRLEGSRIIDLFWLSFLLLWSSRWYDAALGLLVCTSF